MFYVDLQAAGGFVLDNAIPVLQSTLPVLAEFPVDVAQLPPTRAITDHLFGLMRRAGLPEAFLVLAVQELLTHLLPPS